MRLEEYITEAISSGKYGGMSSVISLRDFHGLLLDNLFLCYEMDELPGDNPERIMTKNENLFFKIFNHMVGDVESYTHKRYQDGRTRYYVSVPLEAKRWLVWHVEFDNAKLVSSQLYTYYSGKAMLETDGIDAIEDLVDYLKLKDYKSKKKWLSLNA